MQLPVTRTRIQSRYSDTDAMGHISSGTYITYMEVGRLEFYLDVARMTGHDKPAVIANITLDYFNECYYGDAIEVVTWCYHVGTKSMRLGSDIFANGQLVAKGSVTCVGFNAQTRMSEALPEGWQVSVYEPAEIAAK